MSCSLPNRDVELVQITDAALAAAAAKAGAWLVCRPGCTQCCIGAFSISQLDAARLRKGLNDLAASDPKRASSVQQRAREYVLRVQNDFPGDPVTGFLHEGREAEALFAEFANDEPCPALDPETGTCDLYSTRPMTCRVFGPPVRNEDGALGACELCFHGATDEQIAQCEMFVDHELEGEMLQSMDDPQGNTIVAFALISTH
jgi:Fe-S-cluster containining protein